MRDLSGNENEKKVLKTPPSSPVPKQSSDNQSIPIHLTSGFTLIPT